MQPPSLFTQVTDPATLEAAWERVQAKGAAGGHDGVSVDAFAARAETHLAALHQELREARYVPEPLRQVAIPKGPHTREKRLLHLPAVRDKVVQEALRATLDPILNRLFLDCSYGYRPGKGPQKAVRRVSHYLVHMQRAWAATADIDDFFGSLDQQRLLDRLHKTLGDEQVLHLLSLFLKMGAVDGRGRWRDVRAGVGQGGVISPLLSNFYLHPFDRHLTDQGLGLVRYADDFVILCHKRPEAEAALHRATSFLRDELGLHLNHHPRPVAAVKDGFTFLGVRFQRDGRRLDARKLDKMTARLRQLTTAPKADDVAGALAAWNETVAGWRHYYGALLGPAALAPLEDRLRQALIRLVAHAFRQGAFRRMDQAHAALGGLELLRKRTPAEQKAWIHDVVRTARRAPRPADRKPAAAPSAHKPDPPRTTVAAAVRSKKRRHLQAQAQVSELVVTTPGLFLGKQGDHVVVREGRKTLTKVAVSRLRSVTVATHGIALSSDVVAHCAERGVPLLFVAPLDQPAALLTAPDSPSTPLGLLQLQALAEGVPALTLARAFAAGKIRNQLNLMKYLGKYAARQDPAFADALAAYAADIAALLTEMETVAWNGDLAEARTRVMSVEARAAKGYWKLVGLALADRAPFPGRKHQGARDLVNSMLNYGYALLRSRVHLALLKAGIVPEISFLHAAYKKRPALVFDLMEEFRPYAVDRPILALLRRRQPAAVDKEGRLTRETRRGLISAVHQRFATPVPYRDRRLSLEAVIGEQARRLADHLRGDTAYRPWIGRW